MYFIDFDTDVVTGIEEVDIGILRCHEEVVEERLNSLISYLKSLEEDLLISTIIVCNKSMIIIDGHHRYHALKILGIKKVPVTFINYNSSNIKAYFDDRILKSDVINIVNANKLLPPKSTKHVIFDLKSNDFCPLLLISSIWYMNLNKCLKKK
jgi:hypothetical protein